MLVCASSATAAGWQPVETLDLVRGLPRPQVVVYPGGSAVALYSSSAGDDASARVHLAGRSRGGAWRPLGKAVDMAGEDARVAIAPSGVTAIAAVDRGQLRVAIIDAPGPVVPPAGKPSPSRVVSLPGAGTAAEGPRVGIDESGEVTVAWASPVPGIGTVRTRQVYVATVSPQGLVDGVQALGAPGTCDPDLDVSLSGAAVVSGNCADQVADVYYRPAGGSFGAGESPFAEEVPIVVALDGAGAVHAFQEFLVFAGDGKGWLNAGRYSMRPAAGSFGPPTTIPGFGLYESDLDLDVFDDGRVVAAWGSIGGGVWYSVKRPGGSFGAERPMPGTLEPMAHGVDVSVGRNDLAVVSWRQGLSHDADPEEQPMVATLDERGTVEAARVGVPGELPTPSSVPLSFAIDDSGVAVGAWEQHCASSGPYGVMAVAMDDRRAKGRPPCQDTRPPKAIAVRKRATLAGRRLRVRLACDERCRLTARARVLASGRRKPLATAKNAREALLAPRRGRWVALRMSRAETARVRSARRAGRKVTVRLAVSVRDVYETGRVWRLRLPLRR